MEQELADLKLELPQSRSALATLQVVFDSTLEALEGGSSLFRSASSYSTRPKRFSFKQARLYPVVSVEAAKHKCLKRPPTNLTTSVTFTTVCGLIMRFLEFSKVNVPDSKDHVEAYAEASGSGVPGWVRVPGRMGWKPATKVGPCLVSVWPLASHLLGCRRCVTNTHAATQNTPGAGLYRG